MEDGEREYYDRMIASKEVSLRNIPGKRITGSWQ